MFWVGVKVFLMNKELNRLVVSTTADSLDYVEGIDNCYGITRLHMTAIHNGTTRVLGKYTDPNVFYFSLEDLRSTNHCLKQACLLMMRLFLYLIRL